MRIDSPAVRLTRGALYLILALSLGPLPATQGDDLTQRRWTGPRVWFQTAVMTIGKLRTCRLLNNIRAIASFICIGSSGCSITITFRDFGSVKSELVRREVR